MRIAIFSYEFPPTGIIGGIAAYASEAAKMLVSRGHDVEVFAAGDRKTYVGVENCLVHRIECEFRTDFARLILPVFEHRHLIKPFDVLESPEYAAEAIEVSRHFPELPLVVKLHTPQFICDQIQALPISFWAKLRFFLGGIRRGKFVFLTRSPYDPDHDAEAQLARMANAIAAPSHDIAKVVGNAWNLSQSRTMVFPYPYVPASRLTDLQPARHVRTIGFVGRLELRKGVLELAQEIPSVLRKHPDVRFRLIGPHSMVGKKDIRQMIRKKLGRFSDQVEFVGPVSRENIPDMLGACDAIVLPSRWGNFPFACWEAMAAARVIIASRHGGMPDVIRDRVDGLLVDPFCPGEISEAILDVLEARVDSSSMALSARRRVSSLLAPEKVYEQQMACYESAIRHHVSTHKRPET